MPETQEREGQGTIEKGLRNGMMKAQNAMSEKTIRKDLRSNAPCKKLGVITPSIRLAFTSASMCQSKGRKTLGHQLRNAGFSFQLLSVLGT